MAERVGLLLMAYGTPSGPGDVERYYTDIRGGRPPSPEMLAELKERYSAIGNTFPLARITREQGEALVAELNRDRSGPEFLLYFGMKHSPPFVADAVCFDLLTGPLTGMTMGDLVHWMRSGEAYVNVHSTTHPGGEIRGQIEQITAQ